ncbi:hypothetical protein ACIXMO_10100 [Bacteroides fragilis]
MKNLGLNNVTIRYICDFETEELISLKDQRTKAEYCWTCGPAIIEYFIETFSLNNCTYLDADLMFMASPQIIFDEFDKSVSIAISEHFHNETIGGKYCVQFMYFRNDIEGRKCLNGGKRDVLNGVMHGMRMGNMEIRSIWILFLYYLRMFISLKIEV